MDKDYITIRALSSADIQVMYKTFLLAFSDYSVNFKLTFEQFINKFIHKLQINFNLSAGAFYQGRMVGFLYTALGNYQTQYCAYNGGTGVIPEFRGRNLTKRMYQFILLGLKKEKVEKCYLEVITTNVAALSAYKSIGFKKTRLFHCFKLMLIQNQAWKNYSNIDIYPVTNLDWNIIKTFADTSPSFLDSYEVLSKNLRDEKVIASIKNKEITGYAIYQPGSGRISQLAVKKNFRGRGIGTSLVAYIYNSSEIKELTAMNVDAEAKGLISFLKKLGFENQIDQFEMSLLLNGNTN